MKEVIVNFLSKYISIDKSQIFNILETPPDTSLGDYAFPCFILAKEFKKSPVDIATELSSKIGKSLPKEISGVEAAGPYLNFHINKKILIETIVNEILKKKDKYGKGNEKGKVALEHTSLNPNSSPHVGRARNSFIGDSIKRILEFQGFDVETYYYVNDVSKQIAIMALDFKGKENFDKLLELYVKTNKKLEKNPKLQEKVFDLLKKFESGDKKTRALFKKIVDIAVKGQRKILEEFGIKFDKFDYESSYLSKQKKVLEAFKKTGKLVEDEEGRLVLNQKGLGLENKMKSPILVLTRSNKTGLYPLRDLAYTLDKLKRCKKTLIVLGEDQKLYFDQIKAALKILKQPAPEVVHYSYVLIQEKGKIGKMSTRKGDVVLLEDFMDQAKTKAEKEIKKRKTKGDPKKVGYGSIKYAILKNDTNKNIVFNWEQALNFEGNAGPYLQYSYARANSILKKSKKSVSKIKVKSVCDAEAELIKKLSAFPEIAKNAYNSLNPSILTTYSFELAKLFNEFYHSCPVLKSEEIIQRVGVVKAFMIVQKSVLNLLGIDVLDKM